MNIYYFSIAKSASIQMRTSRSKFTDAYKHHPPVIGSAPVTRLPKVVAGAVQQVRFVVAAHRSTVPTACRGGAAWLALRSTAPEPTAKSHRRPRATVRIVTLRCKAFVANFGGPVRAIRLFEIRSSTKFDHFCAAPN